jgi:hypothetical protein
MTVKEQVRSVLDRLPENASLDDFLSELYVQGIIARAIDDIEHDRIISDEDMRREFLK